jgi:hypothetical protein
VQLALLEQSKFGIKAVRKNAYWLGSLYSAGILLILRGQRTPAASASWLLKLEQVISEKSLKLLIG